jgi:hypothetical protein
MVDGLDPDGSEPVADQLQQDRRHLELRQRRDGMWQLEGKLTIRRLHGERELRRRRQAPAAA